MNYYIAPSKIRNYGYGDPYAIPKNSFLFKLSDLRSYYVINQPCFLRDNDFDFSYYGTIIMHKAGRLMVDNGIQKRMVDPDFIYVIIEGK